MKRPWSVLLGLVVLLVLCGVAQGQPPFGLTADGYVASQGGREALTASSDGPFPGALFRYVKLEVPNRGVWLGGGAEAKIGSCLNLFVQGSYLCPNNVDGTITLDPGATPRLLNANAGSNLDWWYVDAFGTYRLNGPLAVVLGFRYDHHNFFTDSSEVLDILFAPIAQQLGLRLDLNVLSSIPYFGLQCGHPDGVTLRVIYSPFASINVESTLSQNDGVFRPQSWLGGQDTLSSSQFVELYGQYSRRMTPSLKVAIFCRGTWLQGSTSTSLNETLVGGAAQYDVSYHSESWNIGATAELAFDFPVRLYPW
ncbi:MAG: hypothetical protein WBG50_20910 [Desulfomonilaceae bacterium]